MLKAIKVLLNC